MLTITQTFKKFLKLQKVRLSPRTYDYYKDAIFYFKTSLNGYGYQYLDDKDAKLFDKVCEEEGKEFCNIFGPEKISSFMVSEYLGYFLAGKVMAGADFKRNCARVIKKLLKWLDEQGYLEDPTEVRESITVAEKMKDQLFNAERVSNLLQESTDFMFENEENYLETIEDMYEIAKIKPCKLWFRGFQGQKIIGPIQVEKAISDLAQPGWNLYLNLGRDEDGWNILLAGNIYP